MLDVFQGSEYASGLVYGVLTLLVYYCEFMDRSYSVHLQTLRSYFRAALVGCFPEQVGQSAYNTLSQSNSYKSEI